MMGPTCWGWGPGSFFGHPFGMMIGVVFWALVIYGLFVFISNRVRHGSKQAGQSEKAMDILKKRYARGEINAEAFARMKTDLGE